VLLGVALALCLALGLAPVWVSFQALGVQEGDATVWVCQGKVAAARLEKDARLAGFRTCPFAASGAVLQATSTQVVLLVGGSTGSAPILVEWEIANGALMRRWGPCPAVRPATFSHSLYIDNKTMLEEVDGAASTFSYSVAGRQAGVVNVSDLAFVDEVTIELARCKDGPAATASVGIGARVGR
jgi:hypothetical protein